MWRHVETLIKLTRELRYKWFMLSFCGCKFRKESGLKKLLLRNVSWTAMHTDVCWQKGGFKLVPTPHLRDSSYWAWWLLIPDCASPEEEQILSQNLQHFPPKSAAHYLPGLGEATHCTLPRKGTQSLIETGMSLCLLSPTPSHQHSL